MIGRLLRLARVARLVVGLALLAYAARQALAWWTTRPRVGRAPWGASYGIRISPLSPAETARARTLEEGHLTAVATL